MADPFEVRMRFTNLLSHLSASTTASTKTAAYALKHRDLDEDLHSCIIENLERNNMNNRANVMYFLEHFCDMAIREKHEAYVEMVKRDMTRIVDAVAQSGANVKVARKVVGDLAGKGILAEDVVKGIEEQLKAKESETGKFLKDDGGAEEGMIQDGIPIPAENRDDEKRPTQSESQRQAPRTVTSTGKVNGVQKVDKRVIEQRIEEDRERNKRLRESVWAVSGDDEEELNKMWEERSDFGEDDMVILEEEADERRQFARFHEDHVRA